MENQENLLISELSVVLVKLEPPDHQNLIEESCYCRCCFKSLGLLESRHAAIEENLKLFENLLSMCLEPSTLASSFCGGCLMEIKKFNDFREVAVRRQKMFIENHSFLDIQQASFDTFEIKTEPVDSLLVYAEDISQHEPVSRKKDQVGKRRGNNPKCNYCSAHPYTMSKHLLYCQAKKKADILEFSRLRTETKRRKPKKRLKKPISCQYCRYSTFYRQSFKIHMDRHNQKPKKRCKHCDFEYFSRVRMRKHMQEVHADILANVEPITCSTCGLIFKNLASLGSHVKRKHEKEKNLECDHCGKAFFSRSEFKTHWKNMHASEKLICYQCGATFGREIYLSKHMMTHRDISEYLCCELCDKKFALPDQLRNHVNRVHNRQRRFKCTTCGHEFWNNEQLRSHNLKHEGIKFKCYVPGCTSAVTRKSVLVFHMKNNHELTPFEQQDYMKKLNAFCALIKSNR